MRATYTDKETGDTLQIIYKPSEHVSRVTLICGGHEMTVHRQEIRKALRLLVPSTYTSNCIPVIEVDALEDDPPRTLVLETNQNSFTFFYLKTEYGKDELKMLARLTHYSLQEIFDIIGD